MDPVVHITSLEARLLENNLANIRSEMARHGDALIGINESLRTLSRVEESQIAVKERLQEGSRKLTDHEERISRIEQEMPGLKELRRWVIGGILAGVGMMCVALINLVLRVPT